MTSVPSETYEEVGLLKDIVGFVDSQVSDTKKKLGTSNLTFFSDINKKTYLRELPNIGIFMVSLQDIDGVQTAEVKIMTRKSGIRFIANVATGGLIELETLRPNTFPNHFESSDFHGKVRIDAQKVYRRALHVIHTGIYGN